MSERNGDRSRFGRLRKARILLRKTTRELRKTLEGKTPATESVASK